MTLCLKRLDVTAYFCALSQDHIDEHDYRHARVIAAQLENAQLTPDEKEALSRTLHYRISQMLRASHGPTSTSTEYAKSQLEALLSVMKKLDIA